MEDWVMFLAMVIASTVYVSRIVKSRHEQTRRHIQDELNPLDDRLEMLTKQVKDLNERNGLLLQQVQQQEVLMKEVLKELRAPVEF